MSGRAFFRSEVAACLSEELAIVPTASCLKRVIGCHVQPERAALTHGLSPAFIGAGDAVVLKNEHGFDPVCARVSTSTQGVCIHVLGGLGRDVPVGQGRLCGISAGVVAPPVCWVAPLTAARERQTFERVHTWSPSGASTSVCRALRVLDGGGNCAGTSGVPGHVLRCRDASLENAQPGWWIAALHYERVLRSAASGQRIVLTRGGDGKGACRARRLFGFREESEDKEPLEPLEPVDALGAVERPQ